MNDEKPLTFLGFDYGTKSIGVAIGQTITKTAQILTTLKAIDGEPNWDEIGELIKKWRPDAIVVGLPLNMNGTEQPLTEKVRVFIQEMKSHFHIPVYPEDERLTTVEARAELFERGGFRSLKKKAIDALSAKLILESWMKK
ncbi:MAG: Holliday junction resolvase RuvX [Gammaproteobacteria bacterium]|nr:Holliday junction resolvase RuvX [Gammaproteobacteria bacterium]